MPNQRRTPVYFYQSEYEQLRREAFHSHMSISSLIRKIVGSHFNGGKSAKNPAALLKLIGLGSSDADDVSINHDDYLAGLK